MAPLPGTLSRIIRIIFFALNLGTSSFAFSVVATLSPTPTPAPSRTKDTQVAVDGKSTATIPLQQRTQNKRQYHGAVPHNVTLTNYMRLPVEQYVLIPMPLDSSLTRIESTNKSTTTTILESPSHGTPPCAAELFELVIPNITFFRLKLQPVLYATVTPQTNQVIISSDKCVLRGSPFIEKVKLNERFDFNVTTTLTWQDVYYSAQSNSQPNTTELSTISAVTSININVDVPQPFNSIPKRILEATGNAAVKVTLLYIQGNFVSNLAKDYVKWATNVEYRKYRASLTNKGEEGIGVV